MTIKSLGNPYSEKPDLRHGADCGCDSCLSGHGHDHDHVEPAQMSSEEMMERAVESAIVRSVFGHNDMSRRSFLVGRPPPRGFERHCHH